MWGSSGEGLKNSKHQRKITRCSAALTKLCHCALLVCALNSLSIVLNSLNVFVLSLSIDNLFLFALTSVFYTHSIVI